mmetsp:Transcript_39638/g.40404  ORF Transcript_39638/g.40404 Transcript_39638/m.40404 type:complete len:760 (+) Transcript_39638:49-2328(+)|eukprot:CAMPEP_0182425936 /NCGR_PEP_ID=MMETSP1167-20130531/12427_1 /TAXON_ID=2988 /ORGANISM="Mallomonas Sp, Strain CCMP3275" /LENGTH=759 /DNA_ID=CAMNT_0024607037 /DNA_START=49 /DNA_END=2328 /DNA_ORIENTATION=-
MRLIPILIPILSMFRRLSAATIPSVTALSSLLLNPGTTSKKHAGAALCMSTQFDESSQTPLLEQKGLPKFKEITPEHVKPSIEKCLTKTKADFSQFEDVLRNPQNGETWGKRRLEYDYESVIEELEKIQSPLSYSWGVVGHLMGVKNSDALREAHQAVQPNVIEVVQSFGQSQPLFHALKALKDRMSIWKDLDEAQRRVIISSIRGMENAGVGLEKEQREQFNKLSLEQSELSTKFSNNVLDSTKAFKLTLTNKHDIEGLPKSALGFAAQQAVENGQKDATEENGPWLFTLDMPSYLPCMQHLKNREVREKLYRAYNTRASSGEMDNSNIIQRILQIKKEKAILLGYKNYAELSLASKMAPSVDSVLNLTEMLTKAAYPAAQRELETLQEFAKSQGHEGDLKLWDVTYWSERLREQKYEYEEEALRAYFPLDSVLTGLFELAERLFGVTVTPADGETEVWHESVRFFHINDKSTGEHIASFFLDPFSRPAEKRGGAWMDVCIGKSKALNRKPVAYLVCNGSPPVGEKPSLMSFSEVSTLFHEFGHGLQHMLTRIEHADAAGINNVEWDAVELPSQFMENWCYDKSTLFGFAKHYKTGETIPVELFEKVKAAKDFHAGMQMLRQNLFGSIDMELHSTYDPHGSTSPFDIYQKVAPKYSVIPPLPEDRFLNAFGHIFAGGYSAGYYSYKWAEVMSADAFGAFEDAGLDDEEAVQKTGRRFRETVLAMGGGKHPSDVFRAFRGRDPSPDALLRHSGLVGKSA